MLYLGVFIIGAVLASAIIDGTRALVKNYFADCVEDLDEETITVLGLK